MKSLAGKVKLCIPWSLASVYYKLVIHIESHAYTEYSRITKKLPSVNWINDLLNVTLICHLWLNEYTDRMDFDIFFSKINEPLKNPNKLIGCLRIRLFVNG